MGLRAFLSRRIVTPQGIRPGAILVDGERIRDVVAENDVPAHASREDFGNEALLVDWDAWGGLVRNNQKEIPALARMNTLLRKISRAAPRAR